MKQRLIRFEKTEDITAIHQVNRLAFGRDGEANLVDQLRGGEATYSFVAVESGQIAGHIFFSPVEILGKCPNDLFLLGLAPVAVLPDYQHQGIGSLLIRYSLAECLSLGCQVVVVLGDPKYYSRFGFIPAKEKGLKCEYPVPEEAFMVLELVNGALGGYKGIVKYRPEFSGLE